VSPHRSSNPTTAQRLWAAPLYRIIYDPDGRPWQARVRGRLLPSVDRAPHDGTRGSARISSASPELQTVQRDGRKPALVRRCPGRRPRQPMHRYPPAMALAVSPTGKHLLARAGTCSNARAGWQKRPWTTTRSTQFQRLWPR
jgi:hypothetical protein